MILEEKTIKENNTIEEINQENEANKTGQKNSFKQNLNFIVKEIVLCSCSPVRYVLSRWYMK